MTPNSSAFFHLKGSVVLKLDNNLIHIECEGQSIKLTFTSFYGVRKMIQVHRALSKIIQSNNINFSLKKNKIKFFINEVLIAESNPGFSSTLLGTYGGLENTRVYVKNILKYFLHF